MTRYPHFDGTQPCATVPTVLADAFTGTADPAPAKALCRTCPFLAGCRAYALGNDVVGVWGATTGEERQQLRARHCLDAPASISDELDTLVRLWRGQHEALAESVDLAAS